MNRVFQKTLDLFFGFAPQSQIAMGATLGMFVGLIPKDSLIVYLACLLILASAANLYSGILSSLVFTILGWLLGPLLHKLGAVVLTNDSFVRLWASLYQIPGIPWTRANNTTVMGALVASLLMAYPLFQTIRAVAERNSLKPLGLMGHLVGSRFRRAFFDRASVSPP